MLKILTAKDAAGVRGVEGTKLTELKKVALERSLKQKQRYVIVEVIGVADNGSWSVPKGGV